MANGVGPFAPDNPMSPFVCIKVAGKVYDIDVNFITGISVSRSTDAIGSFEFNFEDTMDLSLEEKFMALINETSNDLSFQYGWRNGAKSKWYYGKIYDYNPSFRANFTLSIKVTGTIDNNTKTNHQQSYKGTSISQIVKQVCEQEGWTVVALDESDPLDEERVFVQGNVESIDFITEKLEPEATKSGMPFQFYLDVSADGAEAYFVTIDHYSAVKQNYNFLINAGNYGSVISFEPSYNGSAIAPIAQEAAFFDGETNEISVYEANEKAASEADLAIYNSTSPDRMKPLLANKWFQKNIGCYTAVLVIVGDPEIQPMDFINVMPMRPDGSIHHSGGTYLVTKIDETITTASYTTTLTLTKMSRVSDGAGTMPFAEVVQLRNKE